jgi:ABC-type Zn uptake system ZnuABC Zn-binding protein ZnuA
LPDAEKHLASGEMNSVGRRGGHARGGAIWWAVLLALWVALIAAHGVAVAQGRLSVVTTTGDLRSLTEAVGGAGVEVTALVPPGFDPEEYQPRPQDLVRVRKAQALVRVGLDFDLWADRLLAQASASARRGMPG